MQIKPAVVALCVKRGEGKHEDMSCDQAGTSPAAIACYSVIQNYANIQGRYHTQALVALLLVCGSCQDHNSVTAQDAFFFVQFCPPAKQANRKMTTASSSTAHTTMIFILKFCHLCDSSRQQRMQ